MKKILFTMAALSLTSFTFAQNYGFGDSDFGSGSGDSYEESAPAVTISGEVGTEVRGWIGTTPSEEDLKKDSSLKYDSQGYKKFYDISKSEVEGSVYSNIELNYDGDYTNANIKLKLDEDTFKNYQEDIIDEASVSGNFIENRIQLKAGKMKEVWGKGDKVHVLDNFNANDYRDFIFPDYIDRRIGEVMFKTTANISWDYNLKIEGIYAPTMTADRFASDGHLVPYAQTKLTNTVKAVLKNNYALAASSAITGTNGLSLVNGVMELSDFSTDSLYEDNIRSLKYGQAGLRLTGTLGGIDWGTSYYYGHYKQPSANLEKMITSLKTAATTDLTTNGTTKGLGKYIVQNHSAELTKLATTKYAALGAAATNAAMAELANKYTLDYMTSKDFEGFSTKIETPSLNYDQVQVFGLEAAFVLWKLNTRWEAAYNMTEDFGGTNPWIKNHSVAWVAGFDIDLPIHNLNLNVQETGSYILQKDKIKDGIFAKYDVDYNSDDKYTRNKIIVLLSDKWLNEKLTTEIQGIYGIEYKEFMVAPKIEYNVVEGLTFALRGVYLYCKEENGEFYNFTKDSVHHDKAFVQLTAKYQF